VVYVYILWKLLSSCEVLFNADLKITETKLSKVRNTSVMPMEYTKSRVRKGLLKMKTFNLRGEKKVVRK
jgi:hypothetical protein